MFSGTLVLGLYLCSQRTMISVLELTPATRFPHNYAGGSHKSERHFLDFLIDGQSLWEKLGKPEMVSVLCREYATEETVRAINRLLLAEGADFPNERRSLFICAECAELGCGAITAIVWKEGETVTWEDFGYENTYEENVRRDEYAAVGPFTFNAVSYERTLEEAWHRLTPERRLE